MPPIDPSEFETKAPGDPKKIADDILNYPLDKPRAEPISWQDSHHSVETYTAMVDAISTELITDDKRLISEINDLHEVLLSLQAGKKLTGHQKEIFRDALHIVEHAAKVQDELASGNRELIDPEGAAAKEYDRTLAYQREVSADHPRKKARLSERAAEDALYFELQAHNLREHVKTLFHDLSRALNITLDEGPAAHR